MRTHTHVAIYWTRRRKSSVDANNFMCFTTTIVGEKCQSIIFNAFHQNKTSGWWTISVNKHGIIKLTVSVIHISKQLNGIHKTIFWKCSQKERKKILTSIRLTSKMHLVLIFLVFDRLDLTMLWIDEMAPSLRYSSREKSPSRCCTLYEVLWVKMIETFISLSKTLF